MIQNHRLLTFLRWDLRIVLAILLVLMGIGIYVWAAPTGSPLYTFDFGTASGTDLATGAIQVKAGGSVYPQVASGITFGWDSGLVQAVSRGTSVEDKLLRDYNFAVGSGATFRFKGLAAGNYELRMRIGDSEGTVATKATVQGRSGSMAKTNSFGFFDIPIQVDGTSQEIAVAFTSANSSASWAIDGMEVFASDTVAAEPSFNLSVTPASQTVKAGGMAEYSLGLSAVNGYDAPIDLTLSGLVAGVTAEIAQTQLDSLPAKTQMVLVTDESLAALPYEFLLKAKGADSQSITKTAVVRLTVLAPNSEVPIETPELNQVEGQDGQSAAAVRQQFNLIDDYVATEAEKIVTRNNMGELRDVTNEFVAFPVAPDFPEPANGVERSLQFLTRTGIIGTAVDNAPRGQEDEGPKGFWRKVLDGLASPLGG